MPKKSSWRKKVMQFNPNAGQEMAEMLLILVVLLTSMFGLVYLFERWKKKHHH
jgi:hypothetical protein